jgi:hypothetical protein
MAELRERGVRFKGEIADHGYGLVTYFTMPGGVEVQLYEPKYTKRGPRTKAGASSVSDVRGKRPASASKRRK